MKNLCPTEESGVLIDFEAESDVALVAFTSLGGLFKGPIFELYKILSDIQVKKVFFRDLQWMWYLGGIPGVGKNVEEIATYIRNLCLQEKVKRIVMVGSSAGAYAAILFGILTSANKVLAFSPQTYFMNKKMIPWRDRLNELYNAVSEKSPYLDLRRFILQRENVKTEISIYYSKYNKLDRFHVANLSGIPNIHLYAYPCVGHTTIARFKKRGLLRDLIVASLFEDNYDVHSAMPRNVEAIVAEGAFLARNVMRWIRLKAKVLGSKLHKY